MNDPLYFVHFSDTHFGPTKEFEHYGSNACNVACRMIEAINALPVPLDFVVHTGDVTNQPEDASYRIAAEVFSRVRAPIYYVVGNHDLSEKMNFHLAMGEKKNPMNDGKLVSYAFEKKGYKCIALDARGPDEIDPQGLLGDHQFDFLKAEIASDEKPLVVFVHFPTLPLDSIWLDSGMLLMNGESLHQVLVTVRERVRGVFFGHVHRGMHILKDGVLYSSVASTIGQLNAFPGDTKAVNDLAHPPSFNLVTIIGGQTIIKEHTIPKS